MTSFKMYIFSVEGYSGMSLFHFLQKIQKAIIDGFSLKCSKLIILDRLHSWTGFIILEACLFYFQA